jgi:hypothetical protein
MIAREMYALVRYTIVSPLASIFYVAFVSLDLFWLRIGAGKITALLTVKSEDVGALL